MPTTDTPTPPLPPDAQRRVDAALVAFEETVVSRVLHRDDPHAWAQARVSTEADRRSLLRTVAEVVGEARREAADDAARLDWMERWPLLAVTGGEQDGERWVAVMAGTIGVHHDGDAPTLRAAIDAARAAEEVRE